MGGRQEHESGKKSQKSGKTLKKHLTTVGECGILSELQESSAQVEAKRGKKRGSEGTERKKLEKSLKNLLTSERQSGIINKLRAAR